MPISWDYTPSCYLVRRWFPKVLRMHGLQLLSRLRRGRVKQNFVLPSTKNTWYKEGIWNENTVDREIRLAHEMYEAVMCYPQLCKRKRFNVHAFVSDGVKRFLTVGSSPVLVQFRNCRETSYQKGEISFLPSNGSFVLSTLEHIQTLKRTHSARARETAAIALLTAFKRNDSNDNNSGRSDLRFFCREEQKNADVGKCMRAWLRVSMLRITSVRRASESCMRRELHNMLHFSWRYDGDSFILRWYTHY
jgi:hypothetical protein